MEAAVLINRPIAEVFDLVGNPARDLEWGTLIVESALVTSGALGVGSVFQQTAVFLGIRAAVRLEVTEYELCAVMGYRVMQPVTADHRRLFEETSEGTRLTFYVQVDPPRQYQVGITVMRRRAQRQMESDMNRIKEIMESAPLSSSTP
jgi:hypothetical protein